MTFVSKLATASAVALLAGTIGASANTVSISSVVGTWSNVLPGNTVGLTGVGTNTIAWGTPAAPNTNKSGYSFSGLAPQSPVFSPFTVGTFTHNNYPIQGSPTPSSITGATLDVVLMGDVDGTGFTLNSSFTFSHNETSNSASSCPGQPVPCDDIVTIVSAAYGNDTVNIGGTEFVFNIDGFVSGGNIVNAFATTEDQANSANLQGSFIERPAPIPLPAAGWLLIGGLGGLAALRRRKKAA